MLSFANMLIIRAATETDLPALAHLWHEKMVLQADPRTVLAPNARDSWTAAAQLWLDDGRCGLFTAEREGQVIGYILGWVQPMPGVVPGGVAEVWLSWTLGPVDAEPGPEVAPWKKGSSLTAELLAWSQPT